MRRIGRQRPSLRFQIMQECLRRPGLNGVDLALSDGFNLLDDVLPIDLIVDLLAGGDAAQ
jgi:hypothetical protein